MNQYTQIDKQYSKMFKHSDSKLISFESMNMTFEREQKDKLKPEMIDKANAQFRCKCTVCQKKPEMQKIGDLKIDKFFMDESITKKNQLDFVIQKINEISNQDSQAFLRLDILDTVLFSQGEIVMFIFTDKEKIVKQQKSKEKLKQLYVKNYFLEKRKKQEHELIKDRQMNTKHIKNNQEIALVRYTDDTCQLFSENQFTILMLNRITDKLWQDINYIQLIPKKMDPDFQLLTVRFQYEEQKHCELFKKSLDEINMSCQILNQKENVIERYLQEQQKFEEELKAESRYQFASFQVFKLINYIEAYTKIRINKAQVEFYTDDFKNVYLMGINYLQYFNVDQLADKTNYLKKVRVYNQERQQKIQNQLDEYKRNMNNNKIQTKIKFMNNYYEGLKKDLEIDLKSKEPEDFTSQVIFEQINIANRSQSIHEYIKIQKEKFKNNSCEYRMHQEQVNKIILQAMKNQNQNPNIIKLKRDNFIIPKNNEYIESNFRQFDKLSINTSRGLFKFKKNQKSINYQIPVQKNKPTRINNKMIEIKHSERLKHISEKNGGSNKQQRVVTQIKNFNTFNLENSLPFLLAYQQ